MQGVMSDYKHDRKRYQMDEMMLTKLGRTAVVADVPAHRKASVSQERADALQRQRGRTSSLSAVDVATSCLPREPSDTCQSSHDICA